MLSLALGDAPVLAPAGNDGTLTDVAPQHAPPFLFFIPPFFPTISNLLWSA
jgi:hypothetical protein